MSFYDEEFDSVLQIFDAFPDTRDSLTVRDELEANKYMRVCQRLEAELAQLKAVKDAEVERLNAYYGARAEALEERKAFFERLVKVEESLRKADLKKAFTVANGHYVDESTGEVVPGVTVEEKTSVKVSTTDGGNNE